jgi:hypothetical protein
MIAPDVNARKGFARSKCANEGREPAEQRVASAGENAAAAAI